MNVKDYIPSRENHAAAYEESAWNNASVDQALDAKEQDIPLDGDEIELVSPDRIGLLVLIDQILKHRPRLHRLIRDPDLKGELIPRFLAVSLIGFLFYGVAISIVLDSASLWPHLTAVEEYIDQPRVRLIPLLPNNSTEGIFARWLDGSAWKLIFAYSLGLVAATGVCLPSLYFYSLLSGIRMTMLDVTLHALKSKATAAVALVGLLPIYVAVSMGMIVFHAPSVLLEKSLQLGLILPFIAGLWGTRSLYVGFDTMCDTLPPERRMWRPRFVRRLVLSWSACYSVVMPVMIFTLWEALGA